MSSILSDYLSWHYSRGIKDANELSKNLLWFLWNFFSIGLLLKTLFYPWQRLQEQRRKGDVSSIFETLIINTFMRLIGAFIRLIFIFIGLVTFLISSIFLFILQILWFLFPILIVGSVVTGFIILI